MGTHCAKNNARAHSRLVANGERVSAAVDAEAATFRWVDSCVIGMGLCPFAAPVRTHRDANSGPALRCAIVHADGTDALLRSVRAELSLLTPGVVSVSTGAPSPRIMPESTLLVVLPADSTTFLAEYRDFVHASWDVQQCIVDAGLQASLQVVLFHPQAVHSLYGEQLPSDYEVAAAAEGEPSAPHSPSQSNFDSAATNYSIRSPYPTFHFLRESDIMAAISSGYPQPEQIPARNARKLAALGSATLGAQWQQLRHFDT